MFRYFGCLQCYLYLFRGSISYAFIDNLTQSRYSRRHHKVTAKVLVFGRKRGQMSPIRLAQVSASSVVTLRFLFLSSDCKTLVFNFTVWLFSRCKDGTHILRKSPRKLPRFTSTSVCIIYGTSDKKSLPVVLKYRATNYDDQCRPL